MKKTKLSIIISCMLISISSFASDTNNATNGAKVKFDAPPVSAPPAMPLKPVDSVVSVNNPVMQEVAPVVTPDVVPPSPEDKAKELKQTHEELRNVLKTLVTAINSGKFEDMNSVLSKDIEATPINSEFLSGIKSVDDYFHGLFGEGKKLKNVTLEMNADKLTWLHESGTIGIVSGSGVEKYVLNDGRIYDLKTRWTATVIKEDGHWKMRSFNSSVNFLDNPIINEIESALKNYLPLAGGAGLLVGLVIGFLLGKRKK